MRTIAYILGAILIVLGIVYLLVPAESLPASLPGHEAGMTRVRMKHGLASGAAGVILLVAGWFIGRRG